MQDLDIRGAGNMLGSEQSGFIADLGYETYQRILNEAVEELKNEEGLVNEESQTGNVNRGNEKPSWCQDAQLETDLPVCFPTDYIENISERITLYRELDGLRSEEQLLEFRKRLIDRFGPIPTIAEELIRVVSLRRYGKQLGCEKIMLKQGRMFLYFVSNINSPYYQSETFGNIINYATANVRRCNLRETSGKRSMVIADVPTIEEAVRVLISITGG
jgi:transcription-repair coupling factor (superfamily II helicase)